MFSRQLILGDTLDTDRVQASYTAGVLTLRIPVAEKAKPRKIAIANADDMAVFISGIGQAAVVEEGRSATQEVGVHAGGVAVI